jgi:enediyne biosynthesis protein E4
VDVTKSVGLSFVYDNDVSPARRFIETTGGGCAFIDFDNDGLLDVFAVQGGPAPGGSKRDRPRHALYRNLGGRFQDVTQRAGLGINCGYGQGVAAADYDNDGWTDLLITAYGGPHLFRNRGGAFKDVTTQAGLSEKAGDPHWSTSAAWADFDRDGYLDLFVCRYASWFPDVDRVCADNGDRRIYCDPTMYPGDTSVLYRNNRRGGFSDVSKQGGLDQLEGRALGAVWLDYDADGWPDLFVANDMAPNWLLRNNQDGTFSDRALPAGVAVGPSGVPLAGMGVAAADFAGQGREGLVVVNFSLQPRSYYLNSGNGCFQWAAGWAGVGDPNQPYLAFGVEGLDYDLDGRVDIVMGNGHINQVPDPDTGQVTDRQRQQLFHNQGDGRLAEDQEAAGDLNRPRVSRGLAVGDYDNDGRPDVLVSGPGSPLSLFRNTLEKRGNWVGFRMEGTRSNRDGIGARVVVTAKGRKHVSVVRSGSSYCSRSDTRLRVGLGGHTEPVDVEVVWPSGVRHVYQRIYLGRYYLLREDGNCKPDPRVYRPASR